MQTASFCVFVDIPIFAVFNTSREPAARTLTTTETRVRFTLAVPFQHPGQGMRSLPTSQCWNPESWSQSMMSCKDKARSFSSVTEREAEFVNTVTTSGLISWGCGHIFWFRAQMFLRFRLKSPDAEKAQFHISVLFHHVLKSQLNSRAQ